MFNVLILMAALIGCGAAWRAFHGAATDSAQLRRALTATVYNLFLPALVLLVIWRTPLGLGSMQIAVLAMAAIALGILIALASTRLLQLPPATAGAVILAAAWPNATYMGLPVLEAVYGELGRSTAIQYDLFACTPLLLTLGIIIARHYGHNAQRQRSPWLELLKVPPLWAAVLAVVLNLLQLPQPVWVTSLLTSLGNGVVPLMLLSLGLSLNWQTLHWRSLPAIMPVLLIHLLLAPLMVWGLGTLIGMHGLPLQAVVLEAALPSMVLGLVLCDRYQLDTASYAAAVTLSTLFSMATLPIWHVVVQRL